jgi:pyruvate ferredoxin oxidoreductase alpha subunit
VLAGRLGVAVIDQNLSMGSGGVLHTELAATLHGMPDAPPVLVSFVGGLGGRDISQEELYEMATVTRKAVEEGRTPPPRLLYTKGELREFRKLQALATVERHGNGAQG